MKPWERILHFLVLLFVVLSLFGELFFPSTVRFIFDDLLFPFGLIFLALTFFKKPKWRWIIVAFVSMCAWGMLSDIMANGGIKSTSIGMLVRWLKWPIICIGVAELVHLKIKRNQVVLGIQIIFLALAAINILMMLNPFGFGQWLSELYSFRVDVILSNYHEFGAFRLSGTMANPNNNAVLFGLFLIFFLYTNPRKYWKYILLAFVLVFLTQSRTVLIVVLAILGMYVLHRNTRKTNLILIPAAVISLFVGLFLFRSNNLMSIFNGSAFKSNSWMNRIEHYQVLFNSGTGDLFFGHGIILDPIGAVGFYFDTEYLSIGYQYGLIGLFIWIGAILALLIMLRKTDRKSTFGWAIVIFIFGIAATNFTFLNVECATLMMALIGAWLFFQSNDELHDHSQEESK